MSELTNIAKAYPCGLSCTDIAVIKNNRYILLGRKKGETRWRFPGGFYDNEKPDLTLENAALRELEEETGLNFVTPPEYVCSLQVDDARYANDKDKIVTCLFLCNYINGEPEAKDDLEEVSWWKLSTISREKSELIHLPHQPLMVSLIQKLMKNENIFFDIINNL